MEVEQPDIYRYDEGVAPLDFPYYLAQFRSPEGGTDLDIYYGIPSAELTFEQQSEGYMASIETGAAVFDTLWNVIQRTSDRKDLLSPTPPDTSEGSMHIDSRTLRMNGGQTVLVSLQAEDLKSGRIQSYNEQVSLAGYDSSTLAMSDIVLAGRITPASTGADPAFVRNDLTIIPMASRAFLRGQQIQVYFEVYNLARGEEFGTTEYEMTHEIRNTGRESSFFGRVARFFSGEGRRVGISRVIEGFRPNEFQRFSLDTSNLSEGQHTLIITITDQKTGVTVSKERSFYVGNR